MRRLQKGHRHLDADTVMLSKSAMVSNSRALSLFRTFDAFESCRYSRRNRWSDNGHCGGKKFHLWRVSHRDDSIRARGFVPAPDRPSRFACRIWCAHRKFIARRRQVTHILACDFAQELARGGQHTFRCDLIRDRLIIAACDSCTSVIAIRPTSKRCFACSSWRAIASLFLCSDVKRSSAARTSKYVCPRE